MHILGGVLPKDSKYVVSRTRRKDGNCGQVTNVYLRGGGSGEAGPQGEKGERGPPGVPGIGRPGERGPPGIAQSSCNNE